MGGVATAIETYRTVPTPNVIILETEGSSDILAGLDQLATVCDAGTRVVVIGSVHDVAPYRELVRRGVSDYVIGPVVTLDVVRSICSLFSASEAVAVGRIIAIVGAKGGVGASTVAHNVAWAIARDLALDSVVIDLDLAFGTASLDYNKDPVQGIANAVFSPDRPDTALIERLLAKCTDNLSLLAAPATLERVYDLGAAGLRCDLRYVTHDDALHRAGRSTPMVGMDQARAGRRGRHSDRCRAGPRQSAQYQEHAEHAEGGAAQRPVAAVLSQSGRHAEAPGNQRRANSPRRSRASRSRPFHSIRECSARRPTTAR